MGCNKIEQTCGDSLFSTCVFHQSELPSFSELEPCDTTIAETTDELYSFVGEIKDEIGLSELGDLCLDYVTTPEGKVVVKNVLLKFEEKICELSEKVNLLETINICHQNISACNLDFGTLTNQCDVQPTTLSETLQLILDQLNTQ